MSIVFCDSYDHYTTLTQKYDSVGGGPTITSGAARTGSKGLQSNNNGDFVQKNVANAATYFWGGALAVRAYTNDTTIIQFLDSGTVQVEISIDSSGFIKAYRGAHVTLLGTSTLQFGPSLVFHYVEIKVTVDPSAGVVEVKVDGTFFLQLSSQNTRSSANSQTNAIKWGTFSTGNNTFFFDDVVIYNTTSPNNSYLGDVAVEMNLPTGDGSSVQWTKNGGANNFGRVNENPPDDDTTYNSDATAGHIDYYTFGNISSSTGSVYAVALNLRARKDDAGARSIRSAIKSPATSGAAGDNGADLALSTTYANLQTIFETDPNTSAAWAISAVNAAEYGVKEIT